MSLWHLTAHHVTSYPLDTLFDYAFRSWSPALETTAPSRGAKRQIRIYLSQSSQARLLELQASALRAGFRRPSLAELLEAMVATTADDTVGELLAHIESGQ
jgi:hypothetical protein